MSVIPEANVGDADFCHFTTLPVLPVKVRSAVGPVPVQIVWFADTEPPTETGSIEINTEEEFADTHTPLCTTALK